MNLIERRRAMQSCAPADKRYIRGMNSTGTTLVLPVPVTTNLYMDIDCRIAQNSESGSYHYILTNDDAWGYGGLAMNKTWNQWLSGNLTAYALPPYLRIEIDLPNHQRSVYRGNAMTKVTITKTPSGNYNNASNLKLFLKNTFAYHRCLIRVGSAEYDLRAGADANGSPCMIDVLTGVCYYPAGPAEIVTEKAL